MVETHHYASVRSPSWRVAPLRRIIMRLYFSILLITHSSFPMLRRSVIFLLGIFMWCALPVDGQQSVGMMDMEATVNKWAEMSGVDSLFEEGKDSLQAVAVLLVDQLLQKYTRFQRIINIVCDADTAFYKRYADELIAYQNILTFFEKLIADTIPAFRAQTTSFIRRQVEAQLREMRASGQYYPLVLQEHIIYRQAGYPAVLINASPKHDDLYAIRLETKTLIKRLNDLSDFYITLMASTFLQNTRIGRFIPR